MSPYSVLTMLAKLIASNKTEEADDLVHEYMPSGSGIDMGTKIVWERTTAKRIVLSAPFHHMDEHGFYDGWTDHNIIITPRFDGDFDLQVTGRNRNQIKEYLGDTFHYALSKSYQFNSLLAIN